MSAIPISKMMKILLLKISSGILFFVYLLIQIIKWLMEFLLIFQIIKCLMEILVTVQITKYLVMFCEMFCI